MNLLLRINTEYQSLINFLSISSYCLNWTFFFNLKKTIYGPRYSIFGPKFTKQGPICDWLPLKEKTSTSDNKEQNA